MTMELNYLTWTAVLTALIWVPYTCNAIMVRGVAGATGYPDNPKPLAPWAARMKAAHYNAIENLAVFAALVLAANVANVGNETMAMACAVYFWARVVHLAAYTFRVPVLRTLAFVAGFACQMTLAWQILNPS